MFDSLVTAVTLTESERRQIKEFIKKVLYKLPYFRGLAKTNNNLSILAQDLVDRVAELEAERRDTGGAGLPDYYPYRTEPSEALEDPLFFLGGTIGTEDANGPRGDVFDRIDMDSLARADQHDYIIADKPLLAGSMGHKDREHPGFSFKDKDEELAVTWPKVENPYTDEEKAKRNEETNQFRRMVEYNYPLTMKALSNENRVRAEHEGLVPHTSFEDLEAYEVITLDTLPTVNGTNKAFPENVKWAEFHYYPMGRTKMELYDHDDELINPSVEYGRNTKHDEQTDSLWQRLLNFLKG